MTEHPSFSRAFLPPGEPISGKTYRADGWAYVDPPGRFSPEMWDHFLSVIGEGEYAVIAYSAGIHHSDGLPYKRGQLLVSPTGWANIEALAKQ